ncbi:hypothetical protein BaRGS_00025061 [Batillaria attramentaria]|uniref:Uncharacterized protein n=1 Tax=Batillaria attramentaria TaxID=370345 RepID=A0ABD0K9K8_9CAEN
MIALKILKRCSSKDCQTSLLMSLVYQQKIARRKYQPTLSLPVRSISVRSCLPQASCPHFDPSPAVRLRQILATTNKTSFEPYARAMAASVEGLASSKYVFVSAVSSNHYNELQALVENVQKHVFPRLKNFTFVIFDIGLTPNEHQQMQQLCQCSIVHFPFARLPDFVKQLYCYTWKPPIIQALIVKSEFLIWMDASIRWSKDAPLRDLFSRAAQQGLQLGLNPLGSSIAIRTSNLTFTFYGDQPCQYDPHGEVTGGFGVYHNEPFVRVAILEPWVTCAFDRGCMCVPRFAEMLNCRLAPPRPYGLCHRFDQSSLGIIVSKLFKERTTSLLQLPGHRAVKVARRKFVKWLGT